MMVTAPRITVPARRRRSPSGRARPCGGFTLLEILFAMVLLAFVMAGVWGALAGATRITHSADAVMAASEQVRTVQAFLRTYAGAASPQPYLTAAGAAPRAFVGAPDSMQYVGPLPAQSGHAGLYLQTVSLERTSTGRVALWLGYQPYRADAPAEAEPARHLLLADLAAGSFQYLASSSFGAPPTWRDDWQGVAGLPLAVRIRLQPAWRARVAFPELVIALHAGEGFSVQAGAAR